MKIGIESHNSAGYVSYTLYHITECILRQSAKLFP